MRVASVLLLAVLASFSAADDPSKPHDHQGKLDKFKLGPPPALSSSERAAVDAGKTVSKTVPVEGGARALAVFDVAAPPAVVWACINDLPAYPRMVPGVHATKVYGGGTRGGVKTTLVTWTLKLLGYSVTYHLEFQHSPSASAAAFALDYSRNSDIDDTVRAAAAAALPPCPAWRASRPRLQVGYWHVGPRNGGSSSRVTYSAALLLKGWFPKPVVDFLLSTTLGRATQWVATEARRRDPVASAGSAVTAALPRRRLPRGSGRRGPPQLPPTDAAALASGPSAAARRRLPRRRRRRRRRRGSARARPPSSRRCHCSSHSAPSSAEQARRLCAQFHKNRVLAHTPFMRPRETTNILCSNE